jgi:hypothetical protein
LRPALFAGHSDAAARAVDSQLLTQLLPLFPSACRGKVSTYLPSTIAPVKQDVLRAGCRGGTPWPPLFFAFVRQGRPGCGAPTTMPVSVNLGVVLISILKVEFYVPFRNKTRAECLSFHQYSSAQMLLNFY